MSINKASYLKHLVLGLSLMTGGSYINQALAQNLKLTPQEQQWKGELDQFIDKGYTCIFPQGKFDGENVVDAEGVLSDLEGEQIEQMIEQIKQNNKVKILIVTKEGMTKSGTMENFGTSLGNCLGIGLSKVDNGIVIQLDIKDRKSFIATGYRSETVLTDAECSRICRLGNPYFKSGDVSGGIQAILQGLEEQISMEEVKELTEVEKAEQRRQSEENQQLIYTILMYMLMTGVAGGTGVYIYKKKEEFDKLVSKYNRIVTKIAEYHIAITENSQKLKKEYGKLQSYPFENAPWAINKQEETINQVAETIKSISSNNLLSQYGHIEDSRSSFFKTNQKEIQSQIDGVDDAKKEVTNINNSISSKLNLIKQFFEQYNTINNYATSQKDICISGINHDNGVINDFSSQGYMFSILKEQHNTTSINLISSLEKITSDGNNFDQKLEHSQDADSTRKKLGEIIQSITQLVEQFDENQKNLKNYIVGDTIIKSYETYYEKLSLMIPNELLKKEFDLNINPIQGQQKELIDLYQKSCQTKDIEKSQEYYNKIHQYYLDATNSENKISAYYNNIVDIKAKIPTLIKECDTSITNAQSKLHSYYASDLKSLNERYDLLKKEFAGEKLDWVHLYQKLETIKSEAKNITIKSIDKFESEEKAKQAAIAAETQRQANIKAANEASTNNSNDNSISFSDNSGGGSFGGGGGGSDW